MKRGHTMLLGALLIAFLLLPQVIRQQYFIHIFNLALIYSILALGLQFVIGYAGQFSIGHVAFFGAGAYTSAILTVDLGLPFWVALVGAMFVAGLLGAALAPITRLHGNYMAVATLAFLQIAHLVFLNWVPVTRGALGFLSIPPPAFGPFTFGDDFSYYYLLLVAAILTYVAFRRLVGNTRFGRALAAIRQNELAASSVGVNATAYKVVAFIASAAAAGLAGSLFAHLIAYLNPNDFTLDNQINLVLMIVVGGLGRLEGAILGAFLLTFAPEYMRAFKDYRMILYGLLIVVMMVFMPGGIAGLISDLWRRVRHMLGQQESPGPAQTVSDAEVEVGL